MRNDPPPILVTNTTMLEYMLVRSSDAPIIEASKGKLEWIVLDEAHSYIGSQAAEMALLLRRVMNAFEVDPANVRFVATSATIGDIHGPIGARLRKFLADMAGVSRRKSNSSRARGISPTSRKALRTPSVSVNCWPLTKGVKSQRIDIEACAPTRLPHRYEVSLLEPTSRRWPR